MELWSPPHDAPHLLEWWRPLMLVARRAWADRFPWPVHLDEFRLAGRVKRQGRPDVWIYEHHGNGGSVCVDATGQTYRFIATPRAKGPGQFRPCPVRTALWQAGLPDVVQPIWFEQPRPAPWDEDDVSLGDAPPGGGDGRGPAAHPAGSGDRGDLDAHGDLRDHGDGGHGQGWDGEPRVVRRGHLTLVAG